VPLLLDWLVYCSGPQFIEEIRKASDSELNLYAATDEVVASLPWQLTVFDDFLPFQVLQTPYTFSQDVRDDKYHFGVIRHTLPGKLATCFPDIFDEVQQSFQANLVLTGSGIGGLFL
jgi:hypothetical protein